MSLWRCQTCVTAVVALWRCRGLPTTAVVALRCRVVSGVRCPTVRSGVVALRCGAVVALESPWRCRGAVKLWRSAPVRCPVSCRVVALRYRAPVSAMALECRSGVVALRCR